MLKSVWSIIQSLTNKINKSIFLFNHFINYVLSLQFVVKIIASISVPESQWGRPILRGGQINRLPINQPITDINRTNITVTDSYRSVIG